MRSPFSTVRGTVAFIVAAVYLAMLLVLRNSYSGLTETELLLRNWHIDVIFVLSLISVAQEMAGTGR